MLRLGTRPARHRSPVRPRRRLASLLLVAVLATCASACVPSWPADAAVTVTSSTPTSLELSWPEATVDSDTTVAGYEVSVDGAVEVLTSSTERSARLDDLAPGTTYDIGVRALDAKGQWSSPGLTTEATTPSYPGVAAGTRTVSVTFDGQARTYRLHVPSSVAAQPDVPVPLVVALHGGMGNGQQLATTSQLDVEADLHGFVVAYPEGLLLPTPRGVQVRTWDGGRCCAPAMGSGVDDVGFVASVIGGLEAATAVDRSRVIVGGHSNGAILTWRIACERADVLSAAVIVEGSLERPSCAPSRGVDLVQVHGDSDTNLPLAGGVGSGVSGTNFTSAAASQALWTSGQGCDAPASSLGDHLTITTWPGCADGTTTRQVVIEGGTHAWPGADPANSADLLGEPSPYFSATSVFTDLATAP